MRRSADARCTTATSANPSRRAAAAQLHVEVRKILPKGRGVSFDRLTARDCAVLMSHLNSEPRPALGGMCAIDMLLAALGDDGRELLDALGIEKVPFDGLNMTLEAIEAACRERGEERWRRSLRLENRTARPSSPSDESEIRPARPAEPCPNPAERPIPLDPNRIDPEKRRTGAHAPVLLTAKTLFAPQVSG